MIVESLHEMESRRNQKNSDECDKHSIVNAETVPVIVTDDKEDKYVAAEEKPCTFQGTFSDSEEEVDTKFVRLLISVFSLKLVINYQRTFIDTDLQELSFCATVSKTVYFLLL